MKKIHNFTKILITLIFILFCLSVISKKTKASSETIVINEVMYDPEGSDSGQEWIELKNISSNSLELADWSVQTAGTSFATRLTIEDFQLEAGAVVLIGEEDVTNAEIHVADLGLQNGGSATDGVRVLDPQGNIVDTLLYDEPNDNLLPDESGDPATKFAKDVSSGNSLVRIKDTDNCETDFLESENPTPGTENIVYPIVEVSHLENLYLGDNTFDASDSFDPDGTVTAWSWSILYEGEIIHNLSGEVINVNFERIGEYKIVLEITDNQDNSTEFSEVIEVSEDPQNPIITDIATAKKLEDGSSVSVEGTITAPLESIYDDETYIQDKTGGIRAKISDEIASKIEHNSTCILSGEIDTVYGEKRINVERFLDSDQTMNIKPEIVTFQDFNNRLIGNLVTTESIIQSKRSSYLYIAPDNDSEVLKVKISKYSDIEIPEEYKDKYLKVTGIISQYGTNEDGSQKIRIMPRFQSDIEINSKPTLMANTGSNISVLIFAALAASFLKLAKKFVDRKNLFC